MNIKSLLTFIALLIFLAIYIWLITSIGTSEIVSYIGVENTYLVLFLIAIIIGVSAITAASFYVALITFFLGGANPFILTLVGSIGLTIGDMFFYYLGSKGREVVEQSKYYKTAQRISKWMNKHSEQLVFFLIYLYVAVSPFPKDILATSLGLLSYSFKKSMLAFFFGNITLCLLLIQFFIFFSYVG